ncbi:MAG: amidohydrolase family protein, partial [Firmicutes bacterium]|nr:amidohydrolase family protein [Bacillota bacterium]
GSALNLFECFQKALKFGIPPETALKAVTCNPAKSIGMEDRVGCIERGAYGDLLILDQEWKLLRVI